MQEDSVPLRGRGSAANPPNRFELIAYVRDDDCAAPDGPGPTTHFYKDAARSIIATNDSPDVGFGASINPYRGCEHGCVYCLSGDTPILMADGTTRRLEDVAVGDEIYGTTRRGWYRRYVKTRVLTRWSVIRPAYRVRLCNGTWMIAGGDHRFLTERGWKFVASGERGAGCRPHLTTNNKLMGTGAFAVPPQEDEDYRRGYLCGIIRGDALLASYHYERSGGGGGKQYQFRLALVDGEALERAARYLRRFEVPTHRFSFQRASAARKAMHGIRTHARRHVESIQEIVAWPSLAPDNWCKGFLAGVFDAEGSYGDGCLRMSNTDPVIIEQTTRCLRQFGFAFVIESRDRGRTRPLKAVRVCGGLREHLRFFHTVSPAIARKRDLEGQAVKSSADLRVASVEPLGVSRRLFDITTGTGDFIANGVVSHNCYARPYHEYLGLSAGLDFETKIFVKEDAPELLRRELSSPRWRPRALGLSGVTDAYQPVERRLRLTRRCLEVLAEFRNPVGIVTKNHLVSRDADLLGELARHQAAAVFLSVTTLDGDLARVLEPRASHPDGRLAAVEELTRAGVPAGVMVAPVIPGLTDYEMPAILKAAARAGAQYAGFTLLRLPGAVAELFTEWLARHAPEKMHKILGRVRSVRGGRLNDPRFGSRMRGEGVLAEQIRSLFRLARRAAGLDRPMAELSTAAFRRPGGEQRLLFEQ